ncbi:hypothetical protein [Streptomyces sp. H27-C3]|uniref:hypothetical protein n=1 Tax=Streptomyces sp. H27-C3 TaxID=3046305 RepID=UPI0032D910B7
MLSGADAPTRAALALRRLEGLSESQTRTLLTEAGVVEAGLSPRTAERLARTAGEEPGGGSGALLLSGEFDPCFVHTRPTDLLRRRQRGRAAVAVAAAAVVALAAVTLPALAGAGDEREDARAPVVAAGPVDRSAAGRALNANTRQKVSAFGGSVDAQAQQRRAYRRPSTRRIHTEEQT